MSKSRRAQSGESARDRRALAVTGSRSPMPVVDRERTVVRWSPNGPEVVRPGMSAPRLKRFVRWTAALILLLVAISPVLAWIRYQTLYVTSSNAAVRGYIAEIGTQLDGLVKTIEVDAGDRVTAGQILVRLDDRHFRAEVQEARAATQGLSRRLEVERLAIEHERRQIAQQEDEALANLNAMRAQSAAAEIRADDARQFHEVRASLLSGGGAVSAEDVRAAEAARRTAEALLEEARAKSVAAQSDEQAVRLSGDALAIRERRLGVLEADMLSAEARLARAEADLDSVLIRAPEDGAILRRIVQPGTSVEASQPLISMWLGRGVWIEAWVDEDDIASVRVGSEATVTLRSFPDREFSGIVDKIGLATDFEMPESAVPQPRFSRMRGAPVVGVGVRLDDPPADLVPGMSASVAIGKSAH